MRERAMRANVSIRVTTPNQSDHKIPALVRIGGMVCRALFIIVLTVITARVASPQTETIRSVFETPDEFVRVALGFVVCVWFLVNLFILPKDEEAYRTWLYLGFAVLPLSFLCAFWIW
jgi:hypothetical protein